MKNLFLLIAAVTLAAAAHSQAGHKQAPPISATKKAEKVKAAAASVDSLANKAQADSVRTDSTGQERLYVLQGTLQAFEDLVNALDRSTDSHIIIEALKGWIMPSINRQLQPAGPPKK